MKPTITTIEVDKNLEAKLRQVYQPTWADAFENFEHTKVMHNGIYRFYQTKLGKEWCSRSFYG